MTAWVHAVLLALSAWFRAGTAWDPWEYAGAIAEASEGRDVDAVEVAAELSVLFFTEGSGRPRAEGRDQFGRSLGAWQVHETTIRAYGPSVLARASFESLAYDPGPAAQLAAFLVAESHRVCRRRPPEERLAWFASGGPTCGVPEGLAASRVRMGFVARLLREHPYFWVAEPIWVDRSPASFPKRRMDEQCEAFAGPLPR